VVDIGVLNHGGHDMFPMIEQAYFVMMVTVMIKYADN
jgi:hypothetical protein